MKTSTISESAATLPQRLRILCERIDTSARKYARVPGSVQLLAVSKTQTAATVRIAANAGQRLFGENYLQEALDKMSQLGDLHLAWHFIGPVQSNKTRLLAENFAWIHTVDRARIAIRLSEQRPANLPELRVLLQVNISGEPGKSGIQPAELPELAACVNELPRLRLSGLMCIPAAESDFSRQRVAFRKLREARDELLALGFSSCTELSMGMSGDFEAAIAEGATIIRIGTDIFGPRG